VPGREGHVLIFSRIKHSSPRPHADTLAVPPF
jgi:hypothetical protein